MICRICKRELDPDEKIQYGVCAKCRAHKTLDEVKREHILDALRANNYNRTHTAKVLGISVRCLRNRIAMFREEGINVPSFLQTEPGI